MESTSFLDIPSNYPDENRFILYPIKHPKLWDLYKKHQSIEWHTEEIKLDTDIKHFNDVLNEDERSFIKHVLAFFIAGDVVVGEMLSNHMMNLPMYEAQFFYNYQLQVENIHFDTYSSFVYTLINEEAERNKIYNSAKNDDAMKQKINWVEKYINNHDVTFGERLLALAIVEGLFFSGAFAAIFWLKDRAIMPGLTFANELISRDEFLHCTFACTLLNDHVWNRPSDESIREIIESAVNVEIMFYETALVKNLRKMNKDSMIRYIKYLADQLCIQLHVQPIYLVKNPFRDILSLSSLYGKTNFFERNVSEYEKADIGFQTRGRGVGEGDGLANEEDVENGTRNVVPANDFELNDDVQF